MKVDPKYQYQKVLRFLGVEDDGRDSFPVMNKAKTSRSRLLTKLWVIAGNVKRYSPVQFHTGLVHQINIRNRKILEKDTIQRELKNELIGYFEDDIQLLSRLTNRDLSPWLF